MNPSFSFTILVAGMIGLSACVGGREQKPNHSMVCPHISEPPPQSAEWGRFTAPIRTQWENGGRKMILLDEVHYIDKHGRDWVAPKFSCIDGASIPQSLWSMVGGPYEGLYRAASVIHDVECDREPHTATWQDAAKVFYEAMRCCGVPEKRAKWMYAAVHDYGPTWPDPKPVQPGMVQMRAAPTIAPARREPTAEELLRLKEWVNSENPSLDDIQMNSFRRGVLRHR